MSDRRVVLITGGGRGIGRALARGFAERGYRVVVGSTTTTNNARVADEVRAHGGEALAVDLDVADPASVQRAFQAAVDAFGKVDVLVNNAGVKPSSVPKDASLAKDLALSVVTRMLDVNVLGTFLCCQTWLKTRGERPGGSIVNVSSSSATRARPGDSIYAGTKAAVDALTRVLAVELQASGVAVNSLLPGPTATEETDVASLTPERRHHLLRAETSLPLALFLADQTADGVTGQIIDALGWNVANGLGGQDVWCLAAAPLT